MCLVLFGLNENMGSSEKLYELNEIFNMNIVNDA